MSLTNYITFLATTTTTIIIIVAHRIRFIPRHSWLARRHGQRAQYDRSAQPGCVTQLSCESGISWSGKNPLSEQETSKGSAIECDPVQYTTDMWGEREVARCVGGERLHWALSKQGRFATECRYWKPRQRQLEGSGSGDFLFIVRVWW